MSSRVALAGSIACVVGLLWVGGLAGSAGAAVPKTAQTAYDKKAYQQALDELTALDAAQAAAPDVRRLKIRTLIQLAKPKEALEEYDRLAQDLKRDDEPVLREVSLAMIVVLMKDMREQMRGAAYTALKEIDSDDVVPLFEDGLSDGSGPVRALAVEGLGRSDAGRRSKKLRGALEDQAGLVKARVVKALGRSGDPSVRPLLEAAAKDELSAVRIAALGALVRFGKSEAWEDLRRVLNASNPDDRTDAMRAIADLNDPRGAAPVIEMLTYAQPSVRGTAARTLGHLGQKNAREKIEALLKDPIPPVREAAVASLAELGAVESVPAIVPMLNDAQISVRASAVAALLQLGQPFDRVADTARALAQQSDTAARAAIAFAVGKATKPNLKEAVSFLTELTSDTLPGPKIVALRSLGHIGDRTAVSLMIRDMHDTNEAVRATAAGALLHLLQKKSS